MIKKYRLVWIVGAGIVLLVLATTTNNTTQPNTQTLDASVLQQTQQQQITPQSNIQDQTTKQYHPIQPTPPRTPTKYQAPIPSFQPPQTNPSLSNDNTYINTQGNEVHSPAYSSDNSVPAGATAKCRDGTYSFSQNRRGTCSHHGGVARWL